MNYNGKLKEDDSTRPAVYNQLLRLRKALAANPVMEFDTVMPIVLTHAFYLAGLGRSLFDEHGYCSEASFNASKKAHADHCFVLALSHAVDIAIEQTLSLRTPDPESAAAIERDPRTLYAMRHEPEDDDLAGPDPADQDDIDR